MDQRLADRLEREARAVLVAVPPVRVTLAELERRLGVWGWLAKRKAKSPLSSSAATRLSGSDLPMIREEIA